MAAAAILSQTTFAVGSDSNYLSDDRRRHSFIHSEKFAKKIVLFATGNWQIKLFQITGNFSSSFLTTVPAATRGSLRPSDESSEEVHYFLLLFSFSLKIRRFTLVVVLNCGTSNNSFTPPMLSLAPQKGRVRHNHTHAHFGEEAKKGDGHADVSRQQLFADF